MTLLSSVFMFSSCNDKKDNDSEDIEDPKKPDEVVTEIDNPKEILEKTGIEFLGYIDPEAIMSATEQVAGVVGMYYSYDISELEDAYENILEQMVKVTESMLESTIEDGNYVSEYWNVNCEAALKLSLFSGHFEAKDNKWVYSEAKDLQFIAKDMNGNDAVVKLTTSDKVKKVYLGTFTDNDYFYLGDYETGDGGLKGYERIYVIDNEVYAEMPENILFTFTVANNTMLKLELKPDLSGMQGDEFNMIKDKYKGSASVSILDYNWSIDNVAYDTNGNSAVKMSLSKGAKNLISASASIDTKLGVNGGEMQMSSANNIYINFDILGKVQVKGECENGLQLLEAFNRAEYNDDNEVLFKSYVTEINSMIDFGVYFGTVIKSADIRLEPFADKDFADEYWYTQPVFYFPDNTAYTTFEAFFNEKDFGKVIGKFMELAQYLDAFE